MKILPKFFQVLIILQLLIISSFAQKTENLDKWLKIRPFVNTREDVKRLYGKPSESFSVSDYYYKSDISVIIEYAEGKCDRRYDYNVPKETVIRVTYNFKENSPKIKDLRLNKRNYELKQIGDVEHNFGYFDYKRGIFISFTKTNSEVASITLEPSEKDELSYSCKHSIKDPF